MPSRLRRTIYRYLPWRPWTQEVPIERLLLGGQNGLTAREFSTAADDLMWASTRVTDGPHVDLLMRATRRSLTDSELQATPYGQMAERVIEQTGNFFSATHRGAIPELARQFLAMAETHEVGLADPESLATTGRSIPGSRIRVARIRHSDCYQIVDGHHRAAIMAARQRPHVRARAAWLPVTTPLQETIDAMSWIGGQRELYQPLPAPELEKSWRTVRQCTDRRDKMAAFLSSRGCDSAASYLDVASCYGWFVSEMQAAGLDSWGIERDPLGPVVGKAAYGLDPARIMVGDAEVLLASSTRTWDAVSCLSLLHHFALGRGSIDATAFVRLLDKVTGKVLFLDTGQSHEEWLRHRLPGWDTDHVLEFLRENTTFDEVVDLGPDSDAVPPYEANYGRHLFACVRL